MSQAGSSEQARAQESTVEDAAGTSAASTEVAESAPETATSRDRTSGWSTRARQTLRRPAVLVSAVVVAALLATCAFLGVRLQQEITAQTSRDEALAAGKRHALALTSYDFRNLGGNFAAVTEGSSPRFAQQYKQISDNLAKLIQQYQATSTGTVVNEGIASADENRAVLTLFVDQAVTNTNNPQPRVDRNRMQMILVRDGDRWVLDDVQLV